MAPLTTSQKEYIQKSFKGKSMATMVRETGLPAGRIKEFCDVHGFQIPEPNKWNRQLSKKYKAKKKYVLDNKPEAVMPTRNFQRVSGADEYSNTTPFGIAKTIG